MAERTHTTKINPDIRFSGFTDAWERRKFCNIVNRVSELSNADNLPKVEFEDIVSGEGRLNKDISNKFDSRKGIAFEPDYILYGKLRPYLKNWLFADFKGVALGDFWVFEANDTVPIYNYYLIQTQQYQEIANLSTGTKMPRSDWRTVSEHSFAIPLDKFEQTAIGNFFRTLDNTIALHKRKLNSLKELKKGYLQHMFPQNGESAPRLRFVGFTNEWMERRVGDIFDVTRGQVLAASTTYPERTDDYVYPVYSSQTKNNGLMGYYTDFLFDTAITWTTDGANAGTVNYREGKFYSTNVNGVLLSNHGYANKCNAEVLNMVAWKFVSKVGNPKLMNNIMSEILMVIPQTIEEQEAISNFIHIFDEQITIQQTKLDKLKELKQAYLQKMFGCVK